MDKLLENMAKEVVEKDTYTHDEYDMIIKRIEEISYEDSWESASIRKKLAKFLKRPEDENDESIFVKFFKGLIGVLIELIF